jgi:hypothetical protein
MTTADRSSDLTLAVIIFIQRWNNSEILLHVREIPASNLCPEYSFKVCLSFELKYLSLGSIGECLPALSEENVKSKVVSITKLIAYIFKPGVILNTVPYIA